MSTLSSFKLFKINNMVTSCTKLKEWDNGKGQKVTIYKVELSDGVSGESFGTEIPVNTPLSELIIEDGQYGKKIKWNKPKNGFVGRAKTEPNNAAFCLRYAADIVIAMLPSMEKPKSTDVAKVTTAVADELFKWLQDKK